jgi:hypothetical protein
MNLTKYIFFVFLFSQPSLLYAQIQLPKNSIHFDSFEDSLPLNTTYHIPPPASTLPSKKLSAVNFTFDDSRITAGMLYSVKIDGVDAVDCRFKIIFKIVQCQMFNMPAVGGHEISVKIGNYTKKWNFESVAPPIIEFISPKDNSILNANENPEIVAEIKSTEFVNFKDIQLSFNDTITTDGVILNQVSPTKVGLRFTPKNQSIGQNEVMISATAPSGMTDTKYLIYTVEADKDYSVGLVVSKNPGTLAATLPVQTSPSMLLSLAP